MKPLRTGLALAITVGVFYALCTLVWTLAPGPRPFAWPEFFAARDYRRRGDAQALRRRIRSLRSAHATLPAVISKENTGGLKACDLRITHCAAAGSDNGLRIDGCYP